jgi:23S rRNA (adenine2503-C2)-methyltransferase
MTLEQLQQLCAELQLPRFAAKQIARWLYRRHICSIDEMTDISAAGRTLLKESCSLGLSAPLRESVSMDGTKKYLFRTSEGTLIESAYIPDGERATLCVSSQAGCRMGCRFCATARQGLQHSLSVTDILNQIISLPECERLTNLVFMGMGEPLDNYDNVMRAIEILTADWGFAWSPKRITLSTIGVLPNLKRYLDECRCHLAVSLHDPFGPERLSIMPVQGAWPIQEVIDLIKQYDFTGQRRVSFEYTMFAGFNDTKVHADALIRMLKGLECRMNLIRFHRIPDSPYYSPSQEKMIAFRDTLTAKGIQTTIRASRGEDIKAACGLLSTAEKRK